MMQSQETPPKSVFGTPVFWDIYDKASQKGFRDKSLNGQLSSLIEANIERVLNIKRPEKSWEIIRGWVALKDEQLRNDNGDIVLYINTGDIVIIQYAWDRDVIVTHFPRKDMVSGPLLGGKQSHGLFAPLFDQAIIEGLIKMKLTEYEEAALAFFDAEKKCWNPK